MRPRFIYIEFESGVTEEEYERFSEAAMDLAEEIMAAREPDCDRDIWVSGGGGTSVNEDRMPVQPPIGGFCGRCGHFAARHDQNGCSGLKEPCNCTLMQWGGYLWPRPWLPAPEGLRAE